MINTFSEYNLETGVFTTARVRSGAKEPPPPNPGHAWLEGEVDAAAWVVKRGALMQRPKKSTESRITLTAEVRIGRDVLLQACDWTQLADASLDAAQRQRWAAYRQALRDIPAQPGFPGAVVWPERPSRGGK